MSTTFTDAFRADRVADPVQAYEDVKRAHEWATRQLETAEAPLRRYALTQERKRLADIAWRLRRQ